jgi:hypothetical protein
MYGRTYEALVQFTIVFAVGLAYASCLYGLATGV